MLKKKLFSGKDSTNANGNKLFSETQEHWGNSVFLRCVSHTHTHTHYRFRLVQLWFPTKPRGKFNRPLKQSTNTLGVTPSFKRVSHTHILYIPDGTELVSRLNHLGKIELCSETKHSNIRRILSFKSVTHTHTLTTGLVQIWSLTEVAREIES